MLYFVQEWEEYETSPVLIFQINRQNTFGISEHAIFCSS